MSIRLTEGTQSYVATDTVGSVNYQIVKLDMGSAGTNNLFSGTSNPLPVTLYDTIAGENGTVDVLGVLQKPVVSAMFSGSIDTNFGASLTKSIKVSEGNVYSLDFVNLSGSTVFLQLHNTGTTPASGGTPVYSFPVQGTSSNVPMPRLTLDSTFFAPSQYFSSGIGAAVGTAVGTLGTTGLTASNFIWHIRWI